MGAPLSKTVSVLDRYDTEDGDERLGGGCTYLSARHTLVLDTDTVGDMGDPTTITVTIEPGDTLNG